jgi:hypothetical protein
MGTHRISIDFGCPIPSEDYKIILDPILKVEEPLKPSKGEKLLIYKRYLNFPFRSR